MQLMYKQGSILILRTICILHSFRYGSDDVGAVGEVRLKTLTCELADRD